jgi:hypothetical protein
MLKHSRVLNVTRLWGGLQAACALLFHEKFGCKIPAWPHAVVAHLPPGRVRLLSVASQKE